MSNKIKSFTDLNVWLEGHKLVLEIYKMKKKFFQRRNVRTVINF